MSDLLSELSTPARALEALKRHAAPDVDTRPMRWTSYETVEAICRYHDAESLDCYEVAAVLETTASGYVTRARYEVCWRDDRIRRIALLERRSGE